MLVLKIEKLLLSGPAVTLTTREGTNADLCRSAFADLCMVASGIVIIDEHELQRIVVVHLRWKMVANSFQWNQQMCEKFASAKKYSRVGAEIRHCNGRE